MRMGNKCDLSEFDQGMIVGARQGGLSISETVDLEFSRTTVSTEFAENGAKNKKIQWAAFLLAECPSKT